MALAFLVRGRVRGDKEDTCIVIDAANEREAKALYRKEIRFARAAEAARPEFELWIWSVSYLFLLDDPN
jgi:hypothetical protein